MRAILMYHSIDDSGSAISVSPAVFAAQVHWLARSGMRIVPLDALLDLDPADDRDAIALTFDDGFANFKAAASLLEEHGLPATVFIVTGHVGRTNAWGGHAHRGIPTLPLLDWPGLERLAARGFAIGAHTHVHAPLTTLTGSAAGEEMDRCTAELAARLGIEPSSLAYPYGDVDDDIAALAMGRFPLAVTTRFAALTTDQPRAWIPRLDMYYFRRPGAIRRLARDGFEFWMQWVRWRRSARGTVAPGRAPVGTGR